MGEYKTEKLEQEGLGYIDENGCYWETPLSWFWVGVLGGCGNSGVLSQRAFKLLENFSLRGEDFNARFNVYNKAGDEILAHWFDSAGLTEHGSGIGSSWLTERGERVYKNIVELSKLSGEKNE